jgi:hypothetical protein
MSIQTEPNGVSAPSPEAWAPWSITQLVERLAGADTPWCIAGGWALDIWHRHQTRYHDDIEIAVIRSDWQIIATSLSIHHHFCAGRGQLKYLEQAAKLPSEPNQIWVMDGQLPVWRLEILLEPGDRETWIYRRDQSIRRPLTRMIATTDGGVPYLKPEGVLLYKAKASREKDQADFAACLPLMTCDARHWLRDAFSQTSPGHSWIAELK